MRYLGHDPVEKGICPLNWCQSMTDICKKKSTHIVLRMSLIAHYGKYTVVNEHGKGQHASQSEKSSLEI